MSKHIDEKTRKEIIRQAQAEGDNAVCVLIREGKIQSLRTSFVFSEAFYKAVEHLSAEDRLSVEDAIFRYAFYGIEMKELTPIAASMFPLIKPQIDSAVAVYERKRPGAPKGNQNARKKPLQQT